MGEWLCRIVQRKAARRTARPGDLLHPRGSEDLDQPLAAGVQHVSTPQRVGIPAASARGLAVVNTGYDRASVRGPGRSNIGRGRNRGAGHSRPSNFTSNGISSWTAANTVRSPVKCCRTCVAAIAHGGKKRRVQQSPRSRVEGVSGTRCWRKWRPSDQSLPTFPSGSSRFSPATPQVRRPSRSPSCRRGISFGDLK